jgi:hypothetical protein
VLIEVLAYLSHRSRKVDLLGCINLALQRQAIA